MNYRKILSLFAGVAALSVSIAEGQDVVRLRADSWMPYNGDPEGAKPGFVVEFAREIFEKRGIKVEYANLPWEDTLAAARAGEIDGAICANKEEGAGLVLPTEAVGAPKMVMMTRKDSAWKYESIRSLKDARLGVIAEYSYWEALDGYIARGDSTKVYQASGDAPLDDLFAKLDAGEIDVLIDSEAVLVWKLREAGKTRDDYRAVYRHIPDPVYLAFAPTEQGRKLAMMFDAGMKELVASGRAGDIAASYGLRDWR